MKIDPEVLAGMKALRSEIGHECYVGATISFSAFPGSDKFNCVVYPLGVSVLDKVATFRKSYDDLSEFAPEAREWWEGIRDSANAEKVRNLALALIQVCADKGECLPADLRAHGFSDDDVKAFGSHAEAEALRLSEGGPFKITPGITGNGAPLDEEGDRANG